MEQRRVVAVTAVVLFAALASPAVAQAPTPKVRIIGLMDFVSAWSSNFQDADATRKETEWYSRQRARLTFIGELDKARMVWGTELDFVNGNQVVNRRSATAGFDLDTDVAGAVETKWLYLEFPFTGKNSLLAFVPFDTLARGGGQPFAGHDFKPGVLAHGDFGGLTLISTFSPTVKNTFTYVQIDELNFRGETAGPAAELNRANRDNWAILDSLEVAPTKELTLKPTLSVAAFTGAAGGGGAALASPARAGFAQGGLRSWRGTIGGDLRWRSGPFSLDPTFHYQFGEQQTPAATSAATGATEVDIRSWIIDLIGGWRSGPLLVEGRFTYTSGNDANECVQTVAEVCTGGSDINYYQPINGGTDFYTAWTEIWATTTDSWNALFQGNAAGQFRGSAIGYDKYGLMVLALRATYLVTPALSLVGIISPSWTAQDVDTNGQFTGTALGIVPADGNGDESYLGTELVVGLTWRFAPGLVFDWRYAHLFAGDALDQCQTVGGCTPATGGVVRKAKDVDLVVGRVRFQF